MKQCVSRRRRCWTLLVQMDPGIHVSEGHRSDILLDLSGLSHEERFMVQASINNERDFDRVPDALIIPHPRIHFRESQQRTKAKGKDGFKRGDNSNTRWFRGKGVSKHTGSGKSGSSACYANFNSVEDYNYDDDMNEPADAYSSTIQLTLELTIEEGTLDDNDDEENDTFSSYVVLDDVTVVEESELDASALLADTWTKELDLEGSTQLVLASAQAYISFGKEKRKGKGKGKSKGRYPCSPVT